MYKVLLIGRNLSLNAVRNFNKTARLPPMNELATKINSNNVSEKYESALKKFEGRIWFNSLLEVQSVRLKQHDRIVSNNERRRLAIFQRETKSLPIVLNQFCEGAAVSSFEEKHEEESDSEDSNVQDLPYSRFLKVTNSKNINEDTTKKEEDRVPKNWLQDYELYDEAESEMQSTYGTADPTVPVSKIPCSGCGAHLHCKEPSIPGYIPSELYTKVSENELRTVHCQRCHFLINYNTAINVTVAPEDYIKIISTIKEKFALAIVLVDLLDFPCSIFTGLKDLLGSTRPIFIVGNKV